MRNLIMFALLLQQLCSMSQSAINWDSSIDIADNTTGNLHPRMCVDRLGNPMVIWGKAADQSVYFSRWNGTAFTMPIKLNPAWMTIATASWMGPDIASKGDTIYVVVKRTPETSDTNRLYLFRSFDAGQSFLAPVQLGFIADSISRYPTITTDDLGNPIISFMKFNSSFLESRWVVSKSIDMGASFTTDVKASGHQDPSSEACDCCPGAIVASGSKSIVLYRDNLANIRDIWAGISSNASASFLQGCTVDTNNWMQMSCPSSGPDGVIINDTLYSTYMSGGSGNYRTYLSKTCISNATVHSVVNITGPISGLTQQNYPRIERSGNALGLVWKQNVSGVAQLALSFTNDYRQGFAVSYDTVDIGDVTNTDIAMHEGQLFVVWEDDNARTVKFRRGTYEQVLSSVQEENVADNGSIQVFPNPSSVEWNIGIVANAGIQSLALYNALGAEVANIKYKSDSNNLSIDNRDLAKGLYLLKLYSKLGTYSIKLLKE